MIVQLGRYIGTGLSAIGLIGPGIGIGLIFELTVYCYNDCIVL